MALFFHSDEVDHLIPFPEAVRIVESALTDLGAGRATNAPRKRLHLHYEDEHPSDTRLNIYAGGSTGYRAIGAQVALHRVAIAGTVQTSMKGPAQTELAIIYEAATGRLLGIMAHRPRHVEGFADLRTPATSLAGLNRFARADAARVGVYGSGHQAYSTYLGLTQLRRIESAKVYSPTRAHREAFARALTEQTGVPMTAAAEPAEAARDVDIILCMTNTNVPVLDGAWLSEGQYIVSVIGSNIELVQSGAIRSPRREIDDGTLRRCSRVIALSRAQAIDSQQGDIYWPVQQGVMTWDKVVDIADVLAGTAPGRTDDREILLYKNQGGQGVVDIALAHRLYQLAVETGAGYPLEIQSRGELDSSGWRALPW